MTPFGTRRAADELARRLDAAPGAPALAAPSLASGDVALARALQSAGQALEPRVAPRPEFRDALRMRLVAVATVQATVQATATAGAGAPSIAAARPARPLDAAAAWRRRGGVVAAGALASVVAVSGVAVAGAQSLPGDPFYGVKRTAEALQLRTADGDLEKGTRHLDLAATRLREVRGLTLGRDAVDAGPRLGPAALSGGITLRSSAQPLASGRALSAPVARQVRDTLAVMDEQTREGSALLTGAYRSSRAVEPLRALSRFATRQSAGLEELLPALPPATQTRARLSLALLTGVSEQTDELLGIGTCGLGCDPSQAAPTLPLGPEAPSPGLSGTSADCECPVPAPKPAPQATADPVTPQDQPQQPVPPPAEPAQSPSGASPSPSPSPTAELPLPVPVPTPLPTLPVPLPSVTLSPPPLLEPVESSLPDIISSSTGSGDEPAPAPTPVPQLAPLPPRP